MPRNVQDLHGRASHLAALTLFQQPVALKRLDIELKPMPPKKSRVGDHGRRIRMVGDLAAMPALDLCRIRHMVEMPVRQQQPIHLLPGKLLIGPHRSVKKQIAAPGFQKNCVGIEGAACKGFELICAHVV